MNKVEEKLEIPSYYIAGVFGQFDEHIKLIEKELEVSVILRDDKIKLAGNLEAVKKAKQLFKKLVDFCEQGESIDLQMVKYTMDAIKKSHEQDLQKINNEVVALTYLGKPIKCKTAGQNHYVEQIKKKTVVFGVGPAGTGKTYLAMAMAVSAFRKNEVSKIILTRPAIEAGEKLGFLPGDLQSKVDPYLRPLYDALFEIMGPDNFEKNMEKGLIEVAPLAYMRGRTLNNAFIVLDEAQNTTPEQMKMFLTRIGFNSKVVITGDLTQIDLPNEKKSGLQQAERILAPVEEIGFCYLGKQDVVRHPIVQKIVEAYETFEKK
ncbi:phosphate starvation-inducible protein PhoH [Sporanaerobium hydrogeniformans]|uniref:Phosphate starvation-inducible protein PhoH n=1 Tax=Sporanaerobium hydrogeniformans TaxID=3072179 RepID=A0AC61DDQ2_9FIRM|nr:PhoH family protein [Sporanaerobium hydrogeniformans]PHV71444.1 phosphate starvation-inducible protein PhoH [Sporanaerobium hydrogeniformans]